MARKRTNESRILFPWERHGGVQRWIGLGRLRPIVGLGILLLAVLGIAARERRQADVRQTRAVLHNVEHGVEAYISEHDGGCPPSVEDVAAYVKHQTLRRDAWGLLPRVVCPSRRSGMGFEVFSDGPDRVPGGLDRVE